MSPEAHARWRAPAGAFALYLALGQVQAFTVFLGPLGRLVGLDHSAPEDWRPEQLRWLVPAALAVLGLAGAAAGPWIERSGPRRPMATAAACFAGGLILAGIGAHRHALWLVYLGYAGLAGVGLGIGYLAPLPSLIGWFPERAGRAVGAALAGFGAGALLAAPLSRWLLRHFHTAAASGVMETLATLGVIEFMIIMIGLNALRPPRAAPSEARSEAPSDVPPGAAPGAAPFVVLWFAAFLGITGGLTGLRHAAALLEAAHGHRTAGAAAAGLLTLIALGDAGGRAAWAALSDALGRGRTLAAMWLATALLLAALPGLARAGAATALMAACGLIASALGGTLAVLPLYLAEMYGRADLGPRLGRLLTAWGAAAVAAAWLAGAHLGSGAGVGIGCTMLAALGLGAARAARRATGRDCAG